MTDPAPTAPAMSFRLGWVIATAAVLLVGWHAFTSGGLPAGSEPALTLRDDAFYYFEWARNVAAGRGPVVSDGVWTNGVQVLWGLLLVPLIWIFGAAALPQQAPALGLVLHAATAVLMARVGGFRRGAWAVALIYGLNPFLLREAQNGQETALACLCLTVLWSVKRAPAGVFFGVAVLTVLARVDLWGFVLALSVLRRGLSGIAPAVLTLLPWVLCNLLSGGSLLPHSGVPLPWQVWEAFLATEPDLGAWLHRLWWYLRPVLLGGPWQETQAAGLGALVFLVARPLWPGRLAGLPLLAVLVAVLLGRHDLAVPMIAAFLLWCFPRRAKGSAPRALLALLFGTLLLLLLHYGVRQYPRAYYFAPLVVVGSVALLRLVRLELLLLFGLLSTLGLSRPQDEVLEGQQEMAMAGRFLHEVLPSGEKVGCFNSGIVTWLHSARPDGGPVVNLDGVVNPGAFAAQQARRLSAWLDEQGVRFLADSPWQFQPGPAVHACGRTFGDGFDAARDLVPVCAFDVPGVDSGWPGSEAFVLYWRRGRGPAPSLPAVPRDLGPGPSDSRYVLWPGSAGADLWVESSGQRRDLIRGAADCAYVVLVKRRGGDALTLRSSDRADPVLVLPPL